jgi:hypothetical protein
LLGFLLFAPVAHFFLLLLALQVRFEIGNHCAPATVDASNVTAFSDGGRHLALEGVTWSCENETTFDDDIFTLGTRTRGSPVVLRRSLAAAISCESLSAKPQAGVISYANPVVPAVLRGRAGFSSTDFSTPQLDIRPDSDADYDWEPLLRWTLLSVSAMLTMALLGRRQLIPQLQP